MASVILSVVSAFGFVMILIYMAISRNDKAASAPSNRSAADNATN